MNKQKGEAVIIIVAIIFLVDLLWFSSNTLNRAAKEDHGVNTPYHDTEMYTTEEEVIDE
jgi:hypothetical protein